MNTKSAIEHSAEVNESKISVVAYEKWEKAGHPGGKDVQFWLEAEAQVRTPALAARTVVTAQLPSVASENSTPKTGNGQLGPNRPNSLKPTQKFRRS
jgi:Protein of unknown function (DUF2934)